jgi:hypothetical protein
MGAMPISWQAAVGLAGAAVLWLAGDAGALPWPRPAGASLAGVLALVAVTRIAGDLGISLQRRLRYGVAGTAIAGGAWFAGAGAVADRAELVLLGALHLGAAWLAAGGASDPGERRDGIAIAAAAMTATSLVMLGARGVAAPALLFVLAGGAVIGAVLVTRAHPLGVALAGVGGAGAVILVMRLHVGWLARGTLPAGLDATTPLAGATAFVGGGGLVLCLAGALPGLWRAAAPTASPALRRVLVAVSLPAVLAVAAALVLPFA